VRSVAAIRGGAVTPGLARDVPHDS
jgi:hypothetical protein